MAIRHWHFGKILLLWGITVTILVALLMGVPRHEKSQVVLVWLLLTSPIVVITWKWLSGRETKNDHQVLPQTGAEKTIGPPSGEREKTAKLVVKWLGVLVLLVGAANLARGPGISPVQPGLEERLQEIAQERERMLDEFLETVEMAEVDELLEAAEKELERRERSRKEAPSPLTSPKFRTATLSTKEEVLEEAFPGFGSTSPKLRQFVLEKLHERSAEIDAFHPFSFFPTVGGAYADSVVSLTLGAFLVLVGFTMFRWGNKKTATTEGENGSAENQ